MAAFAGHRTLAQMVRLCLPRGSGPRPCRAPGETVFFCMLSRLDCWALEKAQVDWQSQVQGRQYPQGDHVAVEGVKRINSPRLEVVSI